jgi:hypothetical protein
MVLFLRASSSLLELAKLLETAARAYCRQVNLGEKSSKCVGRETYLVDTNLVDKAFGDL